MKRYVRSETSSKNSDFGIRSYMYMQTLTKYSGKDENVRVPSTAESISATAFAGNTNIKNVFIPDTVTDLHAGLFAGCVNLQSVRLTNNTDEIPKDMFDGCTNLSKVTIPDNVRRILSGAFRNCSSLKSINLPYRVDWIEDEAFSGCTSLIRVNLNDVSMISKYAFENCVSLREITIPESVHAIGVGAFKGCKNLVSVKCLSNIKINRNVFVGCDKLDTSNINFTPSSTFDDPYENEDTVDQESEMTFDSWFGSDTGMDDQNEFMDILESKVRSAYDVAEWFEEPSTQGLIGADNILVTLSSGDRYSFSFNFEAQVEAIYSDGPEAAANYYFNEIKEGIESGSASTDTPTL